MSAPVCRSLLQPTDADSQSLKGGVAESAMLRCTKGCARAGSESRDETGQDPSGPMDAAPSFSADTPATPLGKSEGDAEQTVVAQAAGGVSGGRHAALAPALHR